LKSTEKNTIELAQKNQNLKHVPFLDLLCSV
jgi:hypothetical protein